MSNKDAHQVVNMLLAVQMGLSRFTDDTQSQVIAHVDVTGTELLPKTPFSFHALKDIRFLMAKFSVFIFSPRVR